MFLFVFMTFNQQMVNVVLYHFDIIQSTVGNTGRTFSVAFLTTLESSLTTKSVQRIDGAFNLSICFLTIVSNAISGVKRPVL